METALAEKTSGDAELLPIIKGLNKEYKKAETLREERKRVDGGWLPFGKPQRLERIDTSIAESEKAVERYKSDAANIYEKRRQIRDQNNTDIEILRSKIEDEENWKGKVGNQAALDKKRQCGELSHKISRIENEVQTG